jgi:hypothetical protein
MAVGCQRVACPIRIEYSHHGYPPDFLHWRGKFAVFQRYLHPTSFVSTALQTTLARCFLACCSVNTNATKLAITIAAITKIAVWGMSSVFTGPAPIVDSGNNTTAATLKKLFAKCAIMAGKIDPLAHVSHPR